MKAIFFSSILCLFFFTPPAIYDFKIDSLNSSEPINFSGFKGKKILIVNTACKSPYTFQMEELESLYRAYKDKLVVIGFPAGSDFGEQELKTNKEIREFCKFSYDITFPMSVKTSATGSAQHPIFTYLVEEARKLGVNDPVIQWNFTKFLLDESGALIKVFPADVTPLSREVTSYLNNARISF